MLPVHLLNSPIWPGFSGCCTPDLCRRVRCSRTSIFDSHDTMCRTWGFCTMDTGSGSQRTADPNSHIRYFRHNDSVPFRRRYFESGTPAHGCSIFGTTYVARESISLGQSRTKTLCLQPVFGCASRPRDPMLLYLFHWWRNIDCEGFVMTMNPSHRFRWRPRKNADCCSSCQWPRTSVLFTFGDIECDRPWCRASFGTENCRLWRSHSLVVFTDLKKTKFSFFSQNVFRFLR